jgi:hypothetical protein
LKNTNQDRRFGADGEEQTMNDEAFAARPGWIAAGFPTNCRGCGAPIARGERAVRWPRSGALSCAICAPMELLTNPPASREPRQAA